MKSMKKGIIPYIVLIVFIFGIFFYSEMSSYKVNKLTYDKFIKEVEKNNVKEMEITPKESQGVYEISGKLNGYEKKESYFIRVPLSDVVIKSLLTDTDINYKLVVNPDPGASILLLFIVNVVPILIMVGAAFYFISKQMNSGNKSLDFGKSRAKLSSDKNKINFSNVAGLVEEKEEVKELIDFLKEPMKFQKLGARIPTGILLVGPPGTGKTLLARAVAGEANVPFFYISGSDFVELFVGVGASRVRDMFKQAKASAPCLIFIDEIDAVGRQRGAGLGGGHDEKEQTLNQLLTEMDGFGENEGIIILAATNRPDVLDPALLRPGRFDRQIQVGLPDAVERKAILEVHAANKKFEDGIMLSNIAQRTIGMSGADLENLLNEAALLAVRRNKDAIGSSELDEAHDRILMGPAKHTHKYTDSEKKLVAYHEAGHAVLGIKLKAANEVQKITIIPRGHAGGYNLMIPREEKYTSTESELNDRIIGLLGGRVAEELKFNEISTGAYGDFSQATKIARAMVTEYGMSSLGPVQFGQRDSESVFLGRDYTRNTNFSGKVADEIDTEIRRIIDDCYKKATEVIKNNMDLLDIISNTLLEKETLNKEEIDYLVINGNLEGFDKITTSKVIISDGELKLKTLAELKEVAKGKKLKNYSKMNKDEILEALKK